MAGDSRGGDEEALPSAVDRLQVPEHVANRRRFLTAVSAASVGLAGCLGNGADGPTNRTGAGPPSGEPADGDGTGGESRDGGQRRNRAFKLGPSGFEVERDGGFEPLTVRGVNIGMGVPGRFPGEAAITREQYDRWLAAIGEMNANAVRVYTVHPPAFYRALAAHNRDADDPIYLFQGTWIGARLLHDTGDATALADDFHAELRRTVDVVHGETTLEPRPGHASGEFDADVSNYLLGYIAGIEWPPSAVQSTNEAGSIGTYAGQYVETSGASPFERWLAESLDVVATHAAEEYGTQRPLSVVNWPTTDPLEHPYEPFHVEDMVSVDPDAIVATDAFDAGTFATYHVYPYYPPFLNHTPRYRNYTDHRGEPNTYAGYLDHLTREIEQPILVGEFGVPDSRALAARDVNGRDQGRHTEREQGEHVAAMYEDIVEADTAGGLVFTWHDEWFKRTWNLAAFSDPSGRPLWMNVQTPEERFGLLAFESPDRVRLDGSREDWADAAVLKPTDEPTRLGDGADDQRTLTALRVTHDPSYLSIRVEFESLAALDWTETNLVLALAHTGRGNTTLPRIGEFSNGEHRLSHIGRGNTALPLGTDVTAPPTDFVVRLAGPRKSRLYVDAYYDAFAKRYHERADFDLSRYREQDSNRFVPSRVATNSGYTIPVTEERVPFEPYETGQLRYGNGNPDSDSYDSLADVYVADDAIEIRLPWLLLNVADPSSRLALADLWETEEIPFEEFDAISIGAATYAPDNEGMARVVPGKTNLVHAVPGVNNGQLQTGEYTWETWRRPEYEERRKESYAVVRDAFERL